MRPKIETEETTTTTTNTMSDAGGITTGSTSSGQRRDHQFERQPLAPVQSSKKRKRDRPSLDGEEVDTVRVDFIESLSVSVILMPFKIYFAKHETMER